MIARSPESDALLRELLAERGLVGNAEFERMRQAAAPDEALLRVLLREQALTAKQAAHIEGIYLREIGSSASPTAPSALAATSPTLRTCTHCARRCIARGDNYCMHCGHPQPPPQPRQPAPAVPIQQQPPYYYDAYGNAAWYPHPAAPFHWHAQAAARVPRSRHEVPPHLLMRLLMGRIALGAAAGFSFLGGVFLFGIAASSEMPELESVALLLLLVSVMLAACYGALLWWSFKAPLPAFVIAAAIYGVVQVLNFFLQPELILNVFVIGIAVTIITGLIIAIQAAIEIREKGYRLPR